ncbi:glycoside hydrolase family 3 N-terminal domain-containing protein [uncultured Kordia sp.]|uniref:glycoside hydrolase family 3 N-terminal domain-containing protein n=1 Tax=uncultured Kordia sp. TaxID=507699 RepID=UPI002604837C|nr:glycoside hydrolase family 3 N-terminal domain-containing protein [uncultured Kordia sp.]
MKKYYTITIILIVSLFIISAQQQHPFYIQDFTTQDKWIDSVYTNMTQKERIGQLFNVAAYSNKDSVHVNEVKQMINNYHIGGLTFFQGAPTRQAELTNEYQKLSKIPLLVAMDAEWDLGMRLDSTYRYPWNMTLGAIKNDSIIEQIGARIGKHCKRLGVHINFAPVVDVNTNPNNPIIGNRSYGENYINVANKAAAFTRGMQSEGVIACAKHFPGHGDTALDSHKTLPTVEFSAQRIDSIELFPYKQLISDNIGSIMVAHLNVPSMEPNDGLPASLSYNIVTKKLKHEMGYNGLIFTDALNMAGVAKDSTILNVELDAFLAGNDVLLMSQDVPNAVASFEQALLLGTLTEERLEYSVKNILRAKYKHNLTTFEPIKTDSLLIDLHTIEDDILYRNAMKQAITAVKVTDSLLPLKNLEKQKIAYVPMGDADGKTFVNTLRKYTSVRVLKEKNLADLVKKLKPYTTVIVGFHKSNANPWKGYKFTEKEIVWLQEIARTNTVILDVFTSPYSLLQVKSFTNIDNIVVSYQNSDEAQEISAQIIFGALKAQGKLPVSIKDEFSVGTGIETTTLPRLMYGLPETVGINSQKLQRIDSLARLVVSQKMAPGVQLLIARKGKVIYNKNFGYHTYNKKRRVKDQDIYDVASMTKILATLPLIMKMEESKKITLQSKLEELLPKFKGTNKDTISVIRVLSHYARLKPWIPFYINTLDSVTKKPSPKWYSDSLTKEYSIKVADKMYMNVEYKDSIMQRIIDSDLLERLRYKYSDLPYYILKDYVEAEYKSNLNKLTQHYFYKSLGAHYTTYNPLEKFGKWMIVPSEEDDYYRNQKLQGYVHDMGAAMQGGIGGHAGLFSNANDVAKMMQMYLQGGSYGDKKYFDAKTIAKFNTCYFCADDNRRGVGFDKPQLGDVGPTCGCVSMTSFGHSGFTGTYTWADPDEEIVYVFLSNRTYPTMSNRKLIKTDIRTKIQKLIYEAIEE